MNYLIYDSAITGHHPEYISHLVNYIVDLQLEGNFYFVVSEELKIKSPYIINKSLGFPNIKWEFISRGRVNKIHNLSLLKRSFSELTLVEEYAKKNGASQVLLLYFNIFQIALIFKRTSFTIKGILFLQYLRMSKTGLKNKLKYYRKHFTTKLYCRNSKIKSVFVLNDQNSVDYLNSKFRTNIFNMLPDPIPTYEEEGGFDLHKNYNIPIDKKILLHPGTIDPRKGTYEIIEAIDFLAVKEIKDYAILIVGKANSTVESIVSKKIKELNNKKFTIVFDNSFVSNQRLKSIFLQSFAVLMPYKNSEASSGVLGHSIIANKCVLAPNSGLIGELIHEHEFGVLVEKIKPLDIAKGIELLGRFKLDITRVNNFISCHTVQMFSKVIFSEKK